MLCRVKVTGSGVVVYEGEDGQELPVPRGVFTLKLSDGRYRLTGPAGEYLIVMPDGVGAEVYLEQKKRRYPSISRRGVALATGFPQRDICEPFSSSLSSPPPQYLWCGRCTIRAGFDCGPGLRPDE